MPIYLMYLQSLASHRVAFISCTELSRVLRFDASQIRKDFETAGIKGKPKVGYSVPELIESLRDRLGWNERKPAVLVGAGPMGRAVLASDSLRYAGLEVVGVFDSDERHIGTTAEGRDVMPLGFLPDVVRVHQVKLGIVAVGAAAAQAVVDMMLKARIEAIWSFAPAVLRVPPSILLHNGDLCASFAPLSARLAERKASAVKVATAVHSPGREE
jgi:redox-sensing transcriptional repressor